MEKKSISKQQITTLTSHEKLQTPNYWIVVLFDC